MTDENSTYFKVVRVESVYCLDNRVDRGGRPANASLSLHCASPYGKTTKLLKIDRDADILGKNDLEIHRINI